MLGLGDRLAIARALANHPPLILCDEPTGSLDSEASGGNVTIIVGFAAQLPNITQVLDRTPGVQHSYAMTLVSVQEGGATLTLDDLGARLCTFGTSAEEQADSLQFVQSALGSVKAADLPALPEHDFSAVRQLVSSDAGNPVIVIGENRSVAADGNSIHQQNLSLAC